MSKPFFKCSYFTIKRRLGTLNRIQIEKTLGYQIRRSGLAKPLDDPIFYNWNGANRCVVVFGMVLSLAKILLREFPSHQFLSHLLNGTPSFPQDQSVNEMGDRQETIFRRINRRSSEISNPESTLVQAGEDSVRMVNETVTWIRAVLRDLEKVARKYAALGPGSSSSRSKKIRVKLKWLADFGSMDALENKNSSVKHVNNNPSDPPLLSIVDAEMFKISLSATLMSKAEALQLWSNQGTSQ
ncbi:hypothetical protein K469DRAFT_694786 [Zopfia rhizophila CBS 207.26]|uniref:Uncharacterized protein n=1 Tax=Zopfia rhizophila CBS 207.26 TaxID=1314779 RepID=A0A6A6EP33_9PEZI|nr:hypothetical protein K469DRAFT_694786 [Zopfia rhizophila CBS 207.26]